jgi:hypothetical protein
MYTLEYWRFDKTRHSTAVLHVQLAVLALYMSFAQHAWRSACWARNDVCGVHMWILRLLHFVRMSMLRTLYIFDLATSHAERTMMMQKTPSERCNT